MQAARKKPNPQAHWTDKHLAAMHADLALGALARGLSLEWQMQFPKLPKLTGVDHLQMACTFTPMAERLLAALTSLPFEDREVLSRRIARVMPRKAAA